MQCVLTLHVSPFADTAESTGPHSVSRRSKLMVYIQGHQWSCTETTHFLLSPDLVGFQRMPFPSAGPWVHTTLMTSTVVREKQELRQQRREIIPEWPSAIVKDAGGEIPPGPAGSATMDKNFIYWPRVQLYESSLYFFHAMPEETSFWNSDQQPKKNPVQICMQCVMDRVPPPQTHNQPFKKLPLPRDQHPLSPPSQTF